VKAATVAPQCDNGQGQSVGSRESRRCRWYDFGFKCQGHRTTKELSEYVFGPYTLAVIIIIINRSRS